MLDDANPTKLPKRSQGCPLTLSDLTKKDCTWNWGIEQQNAFEALKKAFYPTSTVYLLRVKEKGLHSLLTSLP